jgi:hypothetical protein
MKSIIKAAIRIIIIIIFVRSLVMLVNNLANLRVMSVQIQLYDEPQSTIYYLYGIYIVGFLVVTAILFLIWKKTDWIVKILAGGLNENELNINTSNMDLIKVAMYILGMYLIVTSIPDLFGLLAYHLRLTGEESELIYTAQQKASTIQHFVTSGITIVIGTWLVLGNRGIAKAIDNILNAPISKEKDE